MRIRDLSIRVKLFSLIGVYAIGFIAFITMLTQTSRLERTATANVIVMKDLVADVLPPPKYIIESYLTLLQLNHAADPAERDQLVKSWERLKKELEDRQTYWEGVDLDDERLKQALLRDSTGPAREFFAIGDKEYLPAVRADDRAKMQALLDGKLHDASRGDRRGRRGREQAVGSVCARGGRHRHRRRTPRRRARARHRRAVHRVRLVGIAQHHPAGQIDGGSAQRRRRRRSHAALER
jgi:hypothetical protein